MLTISNIRAGWLIDGTGGPVQKDVLLRIQHHIIQSIVPAPQDTGPFSSFQASSFQDLSAYTLLPSLVDCHVHLFMSGTDDIAARKRQLEAGYDEMKAVIPVHIARLISCGVGAVRDGGDGKGLVQQYRQSCPGMNGGGEKPPMRAGQATRPGIHLKVAGKAWHQCGRYGKLIGRSPSPGQTLAQAICREAGLPGYISPDHIKVVNSGVNSLLCFGKETLPQFSLAELAQAVCEAGRLQLRVMAHANGKLPVRIAIEAGCHSIEHGFFMGSDNLARMRDRQIVWVPTAFTMQAYADHLAPSSREAGNALRNLAHQMDQIRMARELGVPVAIGTDAGSLGVHHGDSVREEIGILMKAGYTLPEAIQCATKTGSGLLGVRDMGLLSPGMPASWIAVKGGPSGLPDSLDHVLHAE
jgi:imidazolonepropionase-like amidohydrolase